MTEHLSNGQFAPKDVTGPSESQTPKETGKKRVRGKPFVKGDPRCGRPKGVLNKVTRDVKEFLDDLITDTNVQEAVRARLMKGDTVGFFRALENAIGKPTERHAVDANVNVTFGWQESEK